MGKKIEFPKTDKNIQIVINNAVKAQKSLIGVNVINDKINENQSLDLKKGTDNETKKLNKTKSKNGIWNLPNFMFNLIIAIIASLIVWIVSIVF